MAKTPKILVVEDETMLLKTIRFRLVKEGYEVETAANGKEAIDILPQVMPDLIISDIMMPYVNGLELVKHVKEFTVKKIPVILLTTLRQEQNVMKAFELGAEEFMTKPFSPSELIVRVKRVIMRTGIGKD
ncbi:MAG: response regulator [Crocinitomicaceae bacterium]|nr:response regulator [Crocinitomicaceae bacterium]|tara:strand:+ start:8992 stop:9381 length:390 start_codon:yes stop_codon:yes gene_type:complete